MKKFFLIMVTFVIATLSNFADNKYLQIHQNGKISNSIRLDSIEFIEIVNLSDSEKPNAVKKRLFKGGEVDYQLSFDYQEGRITSYSTKAGSYNINYSDSLITIKGPFYDEYYICNNGLITSGFDGLNPYKYDYEDGKLHSIKQLKKRTDENGIETIDIYQKRDFIWDDDIITNQKNWIERNDADFELTKNTNFEYYSTKDYGHVISFIQGNSFLFTYLSIPLLIQGYYGELPKNLIKAINCTSYYYDVHNQYCENKYSYQYTYILDPDDYPLKMHEIYDDGRINPFVYQWDIIEP